MDWLNAGFDMAKEIFFRIIGFLTSGFFWGVAWLLDQFESLGPLPSLILVVLMVAFFGVSAFLLQRGLNKRLEEAPDKAVSLFFLELSVSLLGLVTWPFRLIKRLFVAMGHSLKAIGKKLKRKKGEKEDKEEIKEKELPPPLLVASIGPTFLMSALITCLLYILGLISEPFLREQLQLSDQYPPWQFLFIGFRPELAWFIPLETRPFFGGMLVTAFWLLIWWEMARMIRLALGRSLGRNLIDGSHAGPLTGIWERLAGSPQLDAPRDSYRRWAGAFPWVAVPLLLVQWYSLGGDPYQASASQFALGLIVALSWGLHLRLRGDRKSVV